MYINKVLNYKKPPLLGGWDADWDFTYYGGIHVEEQVIYVNKNEGSKPKYII